VHLSSCGGVRYCLTAGRSYRRTGCCSSIRSDDRVPKTWLQTKRCWITSSDLAALFCACIGGIPRHFRLGAISRWRCSNAISRLCGGQREEKRSGMNTKSRTPSRRRSDCSVHCEMPIAGFTLASRRRCSHWVSMQASLRTVRRSDRPTVRHPALPPRSVEKSSSGAGKSWGQPKCDAARPSCSTARSCSMAHSPAVGPKPRWPARWDARCALMSWLARSL